MSRVEKLGRLARAMLVVLLALGWCARVGADDWNQWRGPNRDGVWSETNTLTTFPEAGADVLWRVPVANGFAGPAVADGRCFVMDYVRREGDPTPNPGKRNRLQGEERVLCLDARTGKELWRRVYDCDYNISYPNGPRATPTVDGDRVYSLGAEGHLHCLDVADGEVLWRRDLKRDYGMDAAPFWGFAAHPLVEGDTIYLLVGGEGSIAVALDKMTGKERWRALSAKSTGYCPPTMIEAGGVRQLIIWHPESLNSLNPQTGEVFWSFPMQPAYDMSIVAPIQHGEYLYATALQGTSLLLKLDPDQPRAEEVWRGKGLHSDHNPPLIVDGYLYGIDGRGPLRCFDLLTGEKKWQSMATATGGRPANSTTGFLVRNGDRYWIMTETGELIVARLSPTGFTELGRAKILEPTTRTSNRTVVWSHPAFADRCLFARNDKEIVCVSLAK